MVTTTCKELAGVDCSVPLSGNSAKELQQTVFTHAQKDHAEMLKKMSPEDVAKLPKRIEEVYNEKSGIAAANRS